MNFLAAYIFFILLIILAFIRPKSIIVHFSLLCAIFLFFAFSYDNADRLVYQYEFESIHSTTSSTYEILYVALMKFGSFFCDTFQQYRSFQAILVLFLIDIIILKYSKAPNAVIACYLIFSALFDATLMRHVVAMAVSLYGILHLLKSQKLKNYIEVLAIFMVGGLTHSAYWVLLLFIPLKILLKGHTLITLVIIGFVFASAIRFQDTIFSLFGLLIVREGVVDKYMTGDYANVTGALYDLVKYIFIISPCFLSILFKKKIEVSPDSNIKRYNRALLLNDNIITANLLFSIILIPQFFAVNYFRLYRVLIIINYIYMSNLYYKTAHRRNHLIAFIMLFYSFTLLFLLLFWESINTLDDVWNMHFETNAVFKWLSI